MGTNVGVSGFILDKNRRGFESYTRQLLYSLDNIKGGFTVYLYVNHPVNFSNSNRIKVRVISSKVGSFLWKNVLLPIYAYKDKIDVFHFPDNSTWVLPYKPTVVTLHDISPVLCAQYNITGKITRVKIRFIYFLISKIARVIITDSNTSKDDIDKFFGFNKPKVKSIPIYCDNQYRLMDENETRKCLCDDGLSSQYVLFVGGIDRRKNLIGLIKAVSILRNKFYKNIDLLVVGEYKNIAGMGYLNEDDIFFNDKDRRFIRLLGYVPKDKLTALYNKACVYVLPSYYEGFGLTVLEAMSCGCPVIVSDMPWGHEITGGNAVFVNPDNEYDIAEKILLVLDNSDLAGKLAKEGLKHIKKYSWQTTAVETFHIYKEVMSR